MLSAVDSVFVSGGGGVINSMNNQTVLGFPCKSGTGIWRMVCSIAAAQTGSRRSPVYLCRAEHAHQVVVSTFYIYKYIAHIKQRTAYVYRQHNTQGGCNFIECSKEERNAYIYT